MYGNIDFAIRSKIIKVISEYFHYIVNKMPSHGQAEGKGIKAQIYTKL